MDNLLNILFGVFAILFIAEILLIIYCISNKRRNGMKVLKDTAEMMNSDNYKERFYSEYWQIKIRYEKLKTFCNKIEAARILGKEEPNHDCPFDLLRNQQRVMGEYLHVLELRAAIENINLGEK